MDVKHENTDTLNAVVKVDIQKNDYQPKVDKILKDYKKSANIPGFRKGHVPLGLIKKQYGQAVLVDEVNKLLQEALNNYISEEKLDILGNPIPKQQDDFDWNKEDYQFEFELGLAPDFEINLSPKKGITHYKIEADKEMVDNQIKSIRKQYGKLVSQNEIQPGFLVQGTFVNEDEGIDHETTLKAEDLKRKKDQKLLIGAKANDSVSFKTKGLFKETSDLAKHLGVEEEKAKDLNVEVNFNIGEINEEILAELNEEFFEKIYPGEDIKTEEDLRKKIKSDAEKQLEQQSDQQLLNDVSEYLIDHTDFDLPSEFLQKWLRLSGEKELTEDEAKEEFEKSEKGLRFQLIEGKIIKDNNLQVTMDEIKNTTKDRIKMQMAQFGQANMPEEQLESITQSILQKEEEAKKISDQIMNQKLLSFYKENVNLKVKKVTYQKFIDEVYK
ncbi:trigger factor [Mesohalobacter halotolerans]|uniref:Trigger factor n=1 Tax=Mesohalobacter halotolerans TaxID=1883405 RepID=A0A4U5TNN3_9FLAO|nr:trigger factor [Mesohalobacter halotolerans]TKS55453.1 trigger factor [Mesohalobacter halotolerans]